MEARQGESACSGLRDPRQSQELQRMRIVLSMQPKPMRGRSEAEAALVAMARAVLVAPVAGGQGDEAAALESRRRAELAVSLWQAVVGASGE